ncbi:protein SRC2-like [Aegilops tauschii subsp. strangulata]|nr:protein SRC2-like [Aegilops tauschii subsp. strangulata]
MAYQILELTLISASDLKKVSFFSRMRVYAVASISGAISWMPTHGTQVDHNNGQNPTWNAMLHLPIPACVDTRGLALHVLLRSEALLFGHHDVGEVFVPLNDLLAGTNNTNDPKTMSYQVRRPSSGRAHGVLYFSYKFTGIKAASASATENKQGQYVKYSGDPEVAMPKPMVPVTAYPQPHATFSYPPGVPYVAPNAVYPPQPYGCAPPPPYMYNTAPAPATMYVYAPATTMAAPARHAGGMGMGLGLGLLGGVVGGMMLGDLESDAAYDAGFNDGMSF